MENRSLGYSKKKKIIDKYNSTSHFYDERYRNIQKMKYIYISNLFYPSNKTILDAGCGTGLFFSFIIENFKEKRSDPGTFYYVGVDISIEMLYKFQTKINKNHMNYKKRIGLILADLEFLPFRNNTFNTLFSLTSYQNLLNIKDGINESIRTLENDAKLRISILKKKIRIEEIESFMKNYIDDLEIISDDSVEDVIFFGTIRK
ncbi:MAG: methyltransferase domain-containing protein [Candidatus Lokiarchaeota archaeon]|nr:methyltransferase domain-containing protein [Candidatus Lokiarchaeota archaeon]